jgi:hypothetical protein
MATVDTMIPEAEAPMSGSPDANANDVIDIPQYGELVGYLQQIIADARKYVGIVKAMQRGHIGLLKKSIRKKRKGQNGQAVPSGFNKPVTLSPMLASFLDTPVTQCTTRSEVTKQLTKYFKDHNLQNPSNRREILLDMPGGERLKPLFPNLGSENLSFFNLQRHLKCHFVIPPPATPEQPVAPVAVPMPTAPAPVAAHKPGVRIVKKIVKKT